MSQRILIVEDNEDNLLIYRTILTHSGFEVIEARDGGEAVRMALEENPAVILMDVSLPVMDGWEATRQIRSRESGHVPIVALTAHARAEDRATSMQAGCDSFLSKPAAPREVLNEVKRLLEAEQGAGAEPEPV